MRLENCHFSAYITAHMLSMLRSSTHLNRRDRIRLFHYKKMFSLLEIYNRLALGLVWVY